MKRNTKIKLLSVLLVGIASFLVFSTAMAADYGLKDVAVKANVAEKDTPGNGTGLPIYIGNIVGTALSLVAILFLIFMVYGGYLWLVSRGNEEMSKKGTDTIFGAIIGIIIILGAYALTNFIFSTVKEAPVQKNMLEQPCPSGSVIICKDTKSNPYFKIFNRKRIICRTFLLYSRDS